MKKILFTLLFLAFIAVYLQADVYIKSQMHTDAMSIMGQSQPASDETIEQWIGNNQMAQITKKMTTVIDLTKKTIYIINHNDKTYVETAYPLDLTKIVDPQAAQMMAMMKMTVTVTPTGQTEKVGQWNCAVYDMDFAVMMVSIKSKVWATTEVNLDYNKYNELAANTMMRMLDEASLAELKKIKGVQVKSETTIDMMGTKVNSNTKVLEIGQKPAAAGVYAVPQGYTKAATIDMTKLQ